MDRFIQRNIRKVLTKILPNQDNQNELNRIGRLKCALERVRTVNRQGLDKIFGADEIRSRWDESQKTLSTFDIPDGTGGVNPGDRRAIYYLIKSYQPETVLEIGTHVGASTVYIAAALADNRSQIIGATPHLVSVDLKDVNDPILKPWLDYGTTRSPLEMVQEVAGKDLVQFVQSHSLEYLSNPHEYYDFVFLDGDSSLNRVYREIPAALGHLNGDGVILLHNYFHELRPLWNDGAVIEGPYLAVARLKAEGVPIDVLPLGELPWPTKKESQFTSLALIVKR